MSENRHGVILTVGLLTLLMLLSSTPVDNLQDGKVLPASARQFGDVDCSNYTFEDLFAYNHARFEIIFLDDWSSVSTSAIAWVNDSLAADVREALDGLFEGFPGGDNDWLSTDEREGVRSIGPKCIADMYTRIGLREGQPHRGGVDWNELSWVEDGVALDELNLVPEDHPEARSCQNAFAQAGCKEVPVHVTDNLEIYLLQDDDEEHNMAYNQLPNQGVEPFTLAFNITNMSDAILNLTFPAISDLRIDAYEVQEDGVTVFGLSEPVTETLEDGRLKVTLEVDYDIADWPMGKNLFIDLTTTVPVPDELPQWSASAPAEDGLIPVRTDLGKIILASHGMLQSWADDEAQVSYDCSIDEGWQWSVESGNMYITPGSGSSAELTCSLIDLKGQQSENARTWNIAQPLTFSAISGEYMDSFNLSITPVELGRVMNVQSTAMQGSSSGMSSNTTIINEAGMAQVDVSNLVPGEVLIDIIVTGDNMEDWELVLDLGIEKESRPPELSLSKTRTGDNGTWDEEGYSYAISGTVFDPDGEAVIITVEVCGYQTSILPEDVSWSADVSVVGCDSNELYVITLTATDESSKSTSLSVEVLPPSEDDISKPSAPTTSDSEDGGLPAPGVLASLAMLALAGLFRRRQNHR